jgi:MFS family permease
VISVRRLRAFGGYPPVLWLLGIGNFLNVLGLSFIWPITTLYIHEYLGRPLTTAGWVLLLSSGGGALGSLAGGYLFDRIGARPVLLAGFLSAAALIALPGFFTSWPLFVGVMFVYGVMIALPTPAMNALVAKAWPEGGRRSFNFLYVAHNVGVAVGTALGGLLAERSYSAAFIGGAVVSLVVGAFTFLFIRDDLGVAPAGTDSTAASAQDPAATVPSDQALIPWLPVGALCLGLWMLWLIYVQWLGPIPVAMQSHGLSLASYSFLWTLNGLIIVLGQPLMTLALKRLRSLSTQLLVGVGLFIISYGLLLLPSVYPVFLGSMVVLTLGEMLMWPAVPAAVAEISPPDRKGFLQGFTASAVTAGRMVGPLIGGLLYDHLGYTPLILVMIALYLVPAAAFFVYRRTV